MLSLDKFKMLEYFNKGGPVMWPLLLVSIVGVAFLFERLWHYHVVTINTPEFLEKIRKVLKQKKIKEAIQICENYRGPIAAILKAGLMKFGAPREEIEQTMSSSAAVELSRLERGLVVLATCSNVAPLLGFLGTVTGMIKSFDVIAAQGLNNPGMVALGISEALITTATGLIIAIPMSLAYNYFTSRIGKTITEMEEASGFLVDNLAEVGAAEPALATAAAVSPAAAATGRPAAPRPVTGSDIPASGSAAKPKAAPSNAAEEKTRPF